MAGDLWWVPSVIVLLAVVAVIGIVIAVRRRRARARVRAIRAADDERARIAAISLVRADDAVQSAADELSFAVAQFGERSTQDFATALATSRRQLHDAFALQQKLDDAVPDTDAERRGWNEQIIVAANEATERIAQHTRAFDDKRGAERDAPLKLDRLRRRLDRTADRVKQGSASLERLSLTYSQRALAPISGNVERAAAALAKARAAASRASGALASEGGAPVGDDVREAEEGLFRADQLLNAIDTGEDELHIGFVNLARALDDADAQLAEARGLRDSHEEPETSARLNSVIAGAAQVIADLRRDPRVSNPASDLERLREAMAGLDIIRSEARNRQLRLENARTALAGSLLAAWSQISVARDFIAANRGRVGAPGRTRLAEAERQLALAEAEADPVAALDAARRAVTLATDAEALARYDAR